MKEQKHTPGPWITTNGFIYADNESHEEIAQMHRCGVDENNHLAYGEGLNPYGYPPFAKAKLALSHTSHL